MSSNLLPQFATLPPTAIPAVRLGEGYDEYELIDAFKLIASRNKNIGYQTLMRQSLKRFAMAEIKRIAKDMEAEVEASEKAQKEALACPKEPAAA